MSLTDSFKNSIRDMDTADTLTLFLIILGSGVFFELFAVSVAGVALSTVVYTYAGFEFSYAVLMTLAGTLWGFLTNVVMDDYNATVTERLMYMSPEEKIAVAILILTVGLAFISAPVYALMTGGLYAQIGATSLSVIASVLLASQR
jgi:hypothetical protein